MLEKVCSKLSATRALASPSWRGSEAIQEGWAQFFDGDGHAISWRPEAVSVLDDGGTPATLAARDE